MNKLIESNEDILMAVGNEVMLVPEVAERITLFESQLKAMKEKEEALKKALLTEMENCGIKKIETPELTISYIAATDRESLDSKALKNECPEIYDSYCKISPVKPSVRIKVK